MGFDFQEPSAGNPGVGPSLDLYFCTAKWDHTFFCWHFIILSTLFFSAESAVTVSFSALLADLSPRKPLCVFHAFCTDFIVKSYGVCELGTLLKQRPPSSHHNVAPPLLKTEHFRWLSQKQPTLSMNFGLSISSSLARCWTDILTGESMNRKAVIRSWK